MLAGPPRYLSGLTFVVLLLLVYLYLGLREPYGGRRDESPFSDGDKDAIGAGERKKPGAAKQSALDFSTPIPFEPGVVKSPGSSYEVTVVIPKTIKDDISWTRELNKNIKVIAYEVDKPDAEYTVPTNKGREAMVYLTYLIDHYDSLPEIILFFHAHRHAWHNNSPFSQDSVATINHLRPERIARLGYMNTRCHLDPGCPDWIHLDRPALDMDYVNRPEEIFYRSSVWRELHPGAAFPASIAAPCCAQFGVSRHRVRQIPRERLEHYRRWLERTKLPDQISGRVLEYTWQYIFTGNAQYCPAAHSCFCEGYGVCFGGAKKYAVYDEKVERRKVIWGEMREMEVKRRDRKPFDQEKYSEHSTEIQKLNTELDLLVKQAEERGKDASMREMEMESFDDAYLWKYLSENKPPESFGFKID